MTKLTKEQARAVYQKYLDNPDGAKTYREFRGRVMPGWDCVMLEWCGMWVGIELDGYAHT